MSADRMTPGDRGFVLIIALLAFGIALLALMKDGEGAQYIHEKGLDPVPKTSGASAPATRAQTWRAHDAL